MVLQHEKMSVCEYIEYISETRMYIINNKLYSIHK